MNQKEQALISEASKHALEILHQCSSASGFRASADSAGYPRCGGETARLPVLGALASEDPDLVGGGQSVA